MHVNFYQHGLNNLALILQIVGGWAYLRVHVQACRTAGLWPTDVNYNMSWQSQMLASILYLKDHLTRRKSSHQDWVLAWTVFIVSSKSGIPGLLITNKSGVRTILIFSVQLLLDTYCLLSLDVRELGMSWKTIQKYYWVLQLNLPFHIKH